MVISVGRGAKSGACQPLPGANRFCGTDEFDELNWNR